MEAKGYSIIGEGGDEMRDTGELRADWLKLMSDWATYKAKQPDAIKVRPAIQHSTLLF